MPMIKTCRHCGETFPLEIGKKRGYSDECPQCVLEKSIYVDPLAGWSDEQREGLYRYSEKQGFEGEACDSYLREFVRDCKDL